MEPFATSLLAPVSNVLVTTVTLLLDTEEAQRVPDQAGYEEEGLDKQNSAHQAGYRQDNDQYCSPSSI